MANPVQLAILKKGVKAWNEWRNDHASEHISLGGADLREANLARADLKGAILRRANLAKANLKEANLWGADLSGTNLKDARLPGANLVQANLRKANLGDTNLKEANLGGANLRETNLAGADLEGANLWRANLTQANLKQASLRGGHLGWAVLIGADLTAANLGGVNLMGANLGRAKLVQANLREANLARASLVDTHLEDAVLTGCRIYGISAWDVRLDGAKQTGLVITAEDAAEITVDDLEVAQFVYLLLNNVKIRKVLDTITSKVVLILGRFTPERKVVLDRLRNTLRSKNYSPVVFDFEKPAGRDLTETVRLLAGMARFVIADITDAKSIPQELMAVVPDMPSVPVQPLLLKSQHEYGMFEHFRRYPWVLKEVLYTTADKLAANLDALVIAPVEARLRSATPNRPPLTVQAGITSRAPLKKARRKG